MSLPERLSIAPASPFHDAEACRRVDKVFVDGKHLPECVAYDIPAGWAKNRVNGVWQPKIYGAIRVTEKQA